MSIREVIDSLKEKGYEVYGPEKLTSYVYFTDGTHIGYVQYNPVGGVSYSSVHMPCRECGTGFQAQDAQEALKLAPSWAYKRDTDAVRKYKDFATFKRMHWQPLFPY
jgi:hypothetical protein